MVSYVCFIRSSVIEVIGAGDRLKLRREALPIVPRYIERIQKHRTVQTPLMMVDSIQTPMIDGIHIPPTHCVGSSGRLLVYFQDPQFDNKTYNNIYYVDTTLRG